MTSLTSKALSRRGLLAGAAGLSACAAASRFGLADAPDSLALAAAAKGILFGASLAVHELDQPYGAQYAEIYKRDAGIITSELEFKLSAMCGEGPTADFSSADRLVAWAQANGTEVRAHTLIWDDDVPAWLKSLPRNEVAPFLSQHVKDVTQRYAGHVRYFDVVNEPIGPWDRKPGNLRNGPFYAAMGENYIHQAFLDARSVLGADAILVLNEAQCETDDTLGATFRDSLLSLLHRLKDKGSPIDAVGLQSHLKLAARYDLPRFSAFLDDIASLGFAIHITELDVNDTGHSGTIADRDAAVAKLYGDYLNEVLEHKEVRVVQTWQLSDANSWMQDKPTQERMKIRSEARPLPYDAQFNRKPAWQAIAQAFEDAPRR